MMGQEALVDRDVLDAHDPLVGFEFGDAVDEQERIAMRKNLLNGALVERQRQGVHNTKASIIRSLATAARTNL
jgi:hypothetical protein